MTNADFKNLLEKIAEKIANGDAYILLGKKTVLDKSNIVRYINVTSSHAETLLNKYVPKQENEIYKIKY